MTRALWIRSHVGYGCAAMCECVMFGTNSRIRYNPIGANEFAATQCEFDLRRMRLNLVGLG